MAPPNPSGLTPPDLRPIVQIDAEKIIGAINSALEAAVPRPVYAKYSNASTAVDGINGWVTLAELTFTKADPLSALQINAAVNAQNLVDGSSVGTVRVTVNDTAYDHLYAVLDGFASGRLASCALPGVLAEGFTAGPISVKLQWNADQWHINPDDQTGTSYSVSAQEVVVPVD